MNRRFGRSVAVAARASLIGGLSALGLLALSATAANADDGGQQGLLGSVTSVVEEVVAPSEAPSGVVGKVSDLDGGVSAVRLVAPVAGVVDSTLSQVPVVNNVLPADAVTSVTQPLLEPADTALSPVLTPVGEVIEPVLDVVNPVIDAVDPVLEVVDPIIEVIDPVVEVVDPVVDPIAPTAPEPAPVIDIDAPAGAAPSDPGADHHNNNFTDPDGVAGSESDASSSGSANGAVSGGTREKPAVAKSPAHGPVKVAFDSRHAPIAAAGIEHHVVEAPAFTITNGQTSTVLFGSLTGDTGTGGGSSGSTMSGGSGAADALTSFFNFGLSLMAFTQYGQSSELPLNPTFDPGSTPD